MNAETPAILDARPAEKSRDTSSSLRSALFLATMLGLAGLLSLLLEARGSGTILGTFGRGRLLRMSPVGLWTLVWGGAWLLTFLTARVWLETTAGRLAIWLRRLGGWNWGIGALPCLLYITAIWSGIDVRVSLIFPRLWLFGLAVMFGAVFWSAAGQKPGYLHALAVTLLGYGVAYQVSLYVPQVGSDPISLGWSEASRYYYASLFFSKSVYGQAYALPFLHPTRYLLQSLPFILPSLPIWVHRAWQVALWLGLTSLGAWLLVRRLGLSSRRMGWLTAAWAFLFFFQGPVYYHLMVCVILILWAFDRGHFWRSLLVVGAASAWAGISRVNWFPVPGLLAVALYLMEENTAGKRFWSYWLPSVAWMGAGLVIALAAQAAYIQLSGNPSSVFGSSLKSPMLWYRLFPSATYPLGVLPGIALAALPLVGLLAWRFWQERRMWNPLRALGLVAILGVLFAGGIVVSAKIGGGSNLHNLDAFLTLLAVIGAYFFFNRTAVDRGDMGKRRIAWWGVALILIPPVAFTAVQGGPIAHLPAGHARADIQALQQMIDARLGQGDVLFINQRQLVTFHQVSGIELVPEYENVDLMEMAMANNRPYLDAFVSDLQRHRFSLIVVSPLNANLQDEEHSFGEENNAWVTGVVNPILQSYSRIVYLKDAGVEVLAPR